MTYFIMSDHRQPVVIVYRPRRLAITQVHHITRRDKKVARYAPVVLYRTLGPSLPANLAPAASLWGISQLYVRAQPAAAKGAGFGGPTLLGGNRLFDAILNSPSGVIFGVSQYSDSWDAVKLPDHKINLNIKEMLDELATIDNKLPPHRPDYPFVLSAGERRPETSQTSIRDPQWMKKRQFWSVAHTSTGRSQAGMRRR
jgi:hypothetical protein